MIIYKKFCWCNLDKLECEFLVGFLCENNGMCINILGLY